MLLRAEKLFFFLTIFFLPTQLGKHFFPDFSYIYSLKIDYLSPTIYFWDLLVLGLWGIWGVRGITRSSFGGWRINMKALGLLLFFLLSQVLSLIYIQNLMGGLVRLEQYFTAGLFGLYISSKSLTEIKDILVKGLQSSIIVVSVIGVGQFLKGGSLELWVLGERTFSLSTPSIATFNFYGDVYLRPYSTLPHPNVLAGVLVVVLPLIVYLKRNSQNSVIFLSLTLGALVSILSFSRGGILVLLAEALIYLRKKLKILAIFLIIPLPFLYTRFSSVFNFDSLSLVRREELAEFSLSQFRDNPIVGIGLNNFINRIAVSSLVSGPSRFLQPVHNIFLLTLVETGILGSLGFLGLLGYPMFKLWRKRKNELARVLLFCFGAVLFLGMFDHYFLTLAQGQRVLFLVWGLAMIQVGQRK